MRSMAHRFPFGQPRMRIEQVDRTANRVFVLGVYASAVHARWVGPDGRDVVRALAVASEPYTFWRGEGAEAMIRKIEVPHSVGKLLKANAQLNGPSGVTLDEFIFKPLGYRRAKAWLCNLVPYSCANPGQQRAIEWAYAPPVQQHGLAPPNMPLVPKKLADQQHIGAIVAELHESKADTLVLL